MSPSQVGGEGLCIGICESTYKLKYGKYYFL